MNFPEAGALIQIQVVDPDNGETTWWDCISGGLHTYLGCPTVMMWTRDRTQRVAVPMPGEVKWRLRGMPPAP